MLDSQPTYDNHLIGPETPLSHEQVVLLKELSEAEKEKALLLPGDAALDEKRRARVEATRPELFGQSAVIERCWSENSGQLEELAHRYAEKAIDRVFLVGAGDSLLAMVAVRQTMELMLGVPCEAVQSLEFAYYRRHVVSPNSLVVVLSSSGRTTRTLEALLIADHFGATTLSVTNSVGSPVAANSLDTLLLSATRNGWPTQSTTVAIAVLLRLAVEIGTVRGVALQEIFAQGLASVPGLIAKALTDNDLIVGEIAAAESAHGMYVFSAAGPAWAAAIAGAAKVKEATPDRALEIHLEEFHHYNSQKPGEPLFLLVPEGPSASRAIDTAAESLRQKGRPYAIVPQGFEALSGYALRTIEMPKIVEPLSALLYVPVAHLLGYHLGMAKFSDAEGASR
jgi:glutamine---fructose-6-phosphate transaminase (isomerizing)